MHLTNFRNNFELLVCFYIWNLQIEEEEKKNDISHAILIVLDMDNLTFWAQAMSSFLKGLKLRCCH